jgi:ubiquinone/menaquinone biosynthesis C-methylase UbiE
MQSESSCGNESRITLRDYFEQRADYWHSVYSGNGFMNCHMKERKSRVLSLVDEISKGRELTILDLGCGAGVLAQSLLDRGHHVVGLDCSQSMLNRMMHSLNENQQRTLLGVVRSPADNTCFPDAQFNVIVCVGVIQYQIHAENVIREISRLLKNGGFCIFTLPNLLCVNHLTDPLYLGRSVHRLWSRLLVRNERHSGETGLYRILGEHPTESKVYNKKYVRWEVRRKFEMHGLILRQVAGFGYGPFTFLGKEVLSEAVTFRISEQLTHLSRFALFQWLSYFANRWVFLAQKG